MGIAFEHRFTFGHGGSSNRGFGGNGIHSASQKPGRSIASSLCNPRLIHLKKAALQPPPASDPFSPLLSLTKATILHLRGPGLGPGHPNPSPCTLSAASPLVLLRAASVHAASLPGTLQGEADVPGQTLMPRRPVSPAPAHCAAAASPGPSRTRHPSSDPRAFALMFLLPGELCHQPVPLDLCSHVTFPGHAVSNSTPSVPYPPHSTCFPTVIMSVLSSLREMTSEHQTPCLRPRRGSPPRDGAPC